MPKSTKNSPAGPRAPLSQPLQQNPHAVREERVMVLEVAIGREVRAFRKQLGLTVAELAAATSLSVGMFVEDRERPTPRPRSRRCNRWRARWAHR